MVETLKLLSACLQESDTIYWPYELNMLRLSTLLDSVTTLIRNDSIMDITGRHDLYFEIATFVQSLASHPGLAILLFENRPDKASSPGLRELGIPTKQTSYLFDNAEK